MDGIANHFPAPKYTRIQEVAYTVSNFFMGTYPLTPTKAPHRLDPDTNFRFKISHCSCFTKRPWRITCHSAAADGRRRR